ncbi:MAG: hypothetical protein IPJ65_41845 [Archangiaceae bacterium]|nr:hypothetical protein [Archangiaceae bacterium]
MKLNAFILVTMGATGCASNLAQMQTARALEPGQLRMSAGVGYYIPATQVGNLAGDGIQVAKQGIESAVNDAPFELSDKGKRSIAIHSVSLAAMTPYPSVQVDARLGVLPRLDVGMRYSVDSVRADAKFNFFHDGVDDPEDGLPRRSKDIAIGFMVSKQLFSQPVGDMMGMIRLDNFNRWDFEIPLYVSIDVSRYFGVYGAGRYRFSYVSFNQNIGHVTSCGCSEAPVHTVEVIPTKLVSHFYGATAGMRVGSARFSWMLELTVGHTSAKTKLLGENVEMGGLTLYPATGIALTF